MWEAGAMSGKPLRETAVTMVQSAPFCDDIPVFQVADVHSVAGLPTCNESRSPLQNGLGELLLSLTFCRCFGAR